MITEEEIRKGFADRLALACKLKEFPDKGKGKILADHLNLTPKAVSKWFNAETMPSPANIYAIAKFLDVSKEWLTYGDKNASLETIKPQRAYPLLSSIQAGLWKGINALDNEQGYEMIPSTILASEDSFYLRIEGKSMLPRFNEGDLVLIDPTLCPSPGDFVAAVNHDNEATFKQYKELGDLDEYGRPHFELVPLNPMFPRLNSQSHQIRIIGVAVQRIETL
ncbi:repressor [Gallibacterium genomosp. 3]|uniref:Repressor n=1 Tax=Gallibacterium genomosp. 3 TaxID=505345 RepID=A0A1A7PRS5_9PAST|nr:S24 family peptidase [Gallibacterium genomosp. 3]OBX03850.1 repressor [Gallibacterium genomosp. 3]